MDTPRVHKALVAAPAVLAGVALVAAPKIARGAATTDDMRIV